MVSIKRSTTLPQRAFFFLLRVDILSRNRWHSDAGCKCAAQLSVIVLQLGTDAHRQLQVAQAGNCLSCETRSLLFSLLFNSKTSRCRFNGLRARSLVLGIRVCAGQTNRSIWNEKNAFRLTSWGRDSYQSPWLPIHVARVPALPRHTALLFACLRPAVPVFFFASIYMLKVNLKVLTRFGAATDFSPVYKPRQQKHWVYTGNCLTTKWFKMNY